MRLECSGSGILCGVPISFRDATMIPVRSPDGGWFEVRMVRADGSKPWPVHTGWLVVVARLVYRAALSGSMTQNSLPSGSASTT